jgi:hypothetical protein
LPVLACRTWTPLSYKGQNCYMSPWQAGHCQLF